jgi:integrase
MTTARTDDAAGYADAVRFVSQVIGRVLLCELRATHIVRVRDRLLADGLAPQTVADVLRVLSQALGRAEAEGWVGKNWAAPSIVNRPVGERPRFEVIDAERARSILKAIAGTEPWDPAVQLALGLGLRREEVLGLQWEDVGDTVKIRRALTYAAGEYHFGPAKSDAGMRDIPVPDFLAAALHRHKSRPGLAAPHARHTARARRGQRHGRAVAAGIVLDGLAPVREGRTGSRA